jgi:hypothetical protein
LLYKAFKGSLRKYAQILNSKLPSRTQQLPLRNLCWIIRQTESNQAAACIEFQGEEVMVCHVITTCEYCADTLEALEDLIRDTIDEEFKSKLT